MKPIVFHARDSSWVEKTREEVAEIYAQIPTAEEVAVAKGVEILETGGRQWVLVEKQMATRDARSMVRFHIDAPDDGESIYITQMIGAMAPMSAETQESIVEQIRSFLECDMTYILCGHSGYAFPDHCVDVNSLMAKIAAFNPEWARSHLVCNLCSHHAVALQRQGDGPAPIVGATTNRAFVHMYDSQHLWKSGEPATVRFGDDAALSDSMADSLIVLGGGVQTFLQILQFLKGGCKSDDLMVFSTPTEPGYASCLFNVCDALRILKKTSHRSARHVRWAILEAHYVPEYASAMAAKFEKASLTPEKVEEARAELAAGPPLLFDPLKRHDADTKMALWRRARDVFIKSDAGDKFVGIKLTRV